MGIDAFAQRSRGVIDGVIIPDLPADEADDMRAALNRNDVALIPMVAPTTTSQRLDHACAVAQGFMLITLISSERIFKARSVATRSQGASGRCGHSRSLGEGNQSVA